MLRPTLKAFAIVATLTLLFSCIQNKKTKEEALLPGAKELKVSSEIYQCKFTGDTIFSEGNFLKYIVVDSFYTVQIGIKGIDTVMGYQFNCESPYKYVPRFFYQDSNSIYLIVHSSPNYREIIICELVNNLIQINGFSMERSAESNKDIFIYKVHSDRTKLFVKGKFNLAKENGKDSEYSKAIKSIPLPKEYQADTIQMTEVHEKELKVHFTNNKELVLPFK